MNFSLIEHNRGRVQTTWTNEGVSKKLKLRPKNRIFDLDRLRAFESKKFEAKVEEPIKI